MKQKVSIRISKETLGEIDRIVGSQSRSEFIERVLLQHLREQERAERDARDLEIINRNAEELNREALDILEYQAPLGEFPDE